MYDNLRTSYLWQHVCQQDRVRRQQQKQSYLQGGKTNTFFIVISEEAGDKPLPIQDLLKCRIGKTGDILTYMTTVD